MKVKIFKLYIFLLLLCFLYTQVSGQTDKKNLSGDEINYSESNIPIANIEALEPFYEKLNALENGNESSIHIVRIGDSHVQAGFFAERARELLQEKFGNGGLGFSFPYRLAGTHGMREVKFKSNVKWHGVRNIFATDADPVGLSGYSLVTDESTFAVKLKISEERDYFNKIKVLTPNPSIVFDVSVSDKDIEMEYFKTEKKQHRVKSGETLSGIARKYGKKISEIKQANGLYSDMIRAGTYLTIPVKVREVRHPDYTEFEKLTVLESEGIQTFYSDKRLGELWLLPVKSSGKYALNGCVLEKNEAGVMYSGIGVNGARYADYNSTDLFFQQLKELQADLLIISLGTNEALDELDEGKYKERMLEFVGNVREQLPDVPILITTPPPFKRKRTLIDKYSPLYGQSIRESAEVRNYAVWDLYQVLGGVEKIQENYRKGWMARDFIHYTKKGYRHSADLFIEALLNAYYTTIEHQLEDKT